MKDPNCFTCEDQGYLVCGNCDKFEDLVVVRREDLKRAKIIWENGYRAPYTVNDAEAINRLNIAIVKTSRYVPGG